MDSSNVNDTADMYLPGNDKTEDESDLIILNAGIVLLFSPILHPKLHHNTSPTTAFYAHIDAPRPGEFHAIWIHVRIEKLRGTVYQGSEGVQGVDT